MLRAMLTRCEELDLLFSKTYEDNTSGKLSDERFMILTKRYDDEQLTLKKKISVLQSEIDAEERHKRCRRTWDTIRRRSLLTNTDMLPSK